MIVFVAGRIGESLVENGRFEAAEQACRSIDGLMIEAMMSGDVKCTARRDREQLQDLSEAQ